MWCNCKPPREKREGRTLSQNVVLLSNDNTWYRVLLFKEDYLSEDYIELQYTWGNFYIYWHWKFDPDEEWITEEESDYRAFFIDSLYDAFDRLLWGDNGFYLFYAFPWYDDQESGGDYDGAYWGATTLKNKYYRLFLDLYNDLYNDDVFDALAEALYNAEEYYSGRIVRDTAINTEKAIRRQFIRLDESFWQPYIDLWEENTNGCAPYYVKNKKIDGGDLFVWIDYYDPNYALHQSWIVVKDWYMYLIYWRRYYDDGYYPNYWGNITFMWPMCKTYEVNRLNEKASMPFCFDYEWAFDDSDCLWYIRDYYPYLITDLKSDDENVAIIDKHWFIVPVGNGWDSCVITATHLNWLKAHCDFTVAEIS